LYYAQHAGTLYLASEVKSLFAAGVPARWDHDAVHQFTSFMTYQQDRSLFAGVRQVPPGHYLVARGDDVRIVRYWDFDYPTIADTAREPDDYVAQFRDALDEAVRLRMHAD